MEKNLEENVVKTTLTRHTEYMNNIKTFTYEEVIALLSTPSPKKEALRLHLQTVMEATTGDIARALGWDRSNTGRRLEELVEEGVVECVDETHHEGGQGRPSRLWRLAE